MRYIQASVGRRARSEWYAYIPHLDLTVVGSSEEKVKHATWNTVEEAEGLHAFTIVWS